MITDNLRRGRMEIAVSASQGSFLPDRNRGEQTLTPKEKTTAALSGNIVALKLARNGFQKTVF